MIEPNKLCREGGCPWDMKVGRRFLCTMKASIKRRPILGHPQTESCSIAQYSVSCEELEIFVGHESEL